MKAVRWKLLKSDPNCWQSSVVTLPFDLLTQNVLYYIIYVPLTILHLCLKYESCMLKPSSYRVRTKLLSVDNAQLWPWPSTFWLKHVLVSSFHHPASMHYKWKLYVQHYMYSNYSVRTKVLTKFSCDLDLWPLDHKMYRYLPLTILNLCMKYEISTFETTLVFESEPKC